VIPQGALWTPWTGGPWTNIRNEPFAQGFTHLYLGNTFDTYAGTWTGVFPNQYVESDDVFANLLAGRSEGNMVLLRKWRDYRDNGTLVIRPRMTRISAGNWELDVPDHFLAFFEEQPLFSVVRYVTDTTAIVRNNLGNEFHIRMKPGDKVTSTLKTLYDRAFEVPGVETAIAIHLTTRPNSNGSAISGGIMPGGIVRIDKYTKGSNGETIITDLGFLPLTDSMCLTLHSPDSGDDVIGYRFHLVRAPLGLTLEGAWATDQISPDSGIILTNREFDVSRLEQRHQHLYSGEFAPRREPNGSFSVFNRVYDGKSPITPEDRRDGGGLRFREDGFRSLSIYAPTDPAIGLVGNFSEDNLW
jgi:hypothetical protein